MTKNVEDDELVIYTIYGHPKDYPDKFVVRAWTVVDGKEHPSAECKLADSLKEARRLVPRGFVRLDRHPSDDPVIVESWI